MNNKQVHIFFAIDDNYAPFFKIAVKSMMMNSNNNYHYNIYILHTDLSESVKESILSVSQENYTINFVDMSEKIKYIKEKLHTRDYYSKAIYFRLFIPTMFPHLDKALYLDSDIVIPGDISELYNTDLGTNLVGAIPDEAVSYVEEFIEYVNKYLGVHHTKYFNSGILLMNLKELRKFDFENKFISLLNQIAFTVAPDQDYLNCICKDRVTYVSRVWNKQPFPSDEFTIDNINLIHYNLTAKPWHYDVLYKEVFYKYAEELGLAEQMKHLKENYTDEQKQNDAMGEKSLRKLCHHLANVEDTYVALKASGKIKI